MIIAVNRSRWWRLLPLALMLSACGSTPGVEPAAEPTSPAESTRSRGPDGRFLSGKCDYVTVEEMVKATGLQTVKPVETLYGCSYLYNPADEMPKSFTDMKSVGEDGVVPPSVTILYSDSEYSISGTKKYLADPALRKVSGVGAGAVWDEDPAAQIWQLDVLTAHGTVRVMLDQDPNLRSDDLTEIAVEIFRYAEPRLP